MMEEEGGVLGNGREASGVRGDLPKKVAEYERFLNNRLKTDLQTLLDSRDLVYADIAEYLQLQRVLERLDAGTERKGVLKTMVDLGCNFYSQALVPDPQHMCVAVGFGVFVELTRSEALQFIEKKVAGLNKKAEELTAQACQVKARIRIVVEGLRELQFADLPTSPPHRPVW
ncbi:Protein UXT homolog [Geodia barretti]|uniref:Protein UXT homolog n=1 Tax=Geodia barretti TaxID=519541 RepID=A0AA35W1D8_GEOBA|nr:Protein UXT homolog [Geodia barretti]